MVFARVENADIQLQEWLAHNLKVGLQYLII